MTVGRDYNAAILTGYSNAHIIWFGLRLEGGRIMINRYRDVDPGF